MSASKKKVVPFICIPTMAPVQTHAWGRQRKISVGTQTRCRTKAGRGNLVAGSKSKHRKERILTCLQTRARLMNHHRGWIHESPIGNIESIHSCTHFKLEFSKILWKLVNSKRTVYTIFDDLFSSVPFSEQVCDAKYARANCREQNVFESWSNQCRASKCVNGTSNSNVQLLMIRNILHRPCVILFMHSIEINDFEMFLLNF